MSFGLKLITDATLEPITLDDAKGYLRIDLSDTASDTLVTSLIRAARRHCEKYTNLAFINQTWELWRNSFPQSCGGSNAWWDGVREGTIRDLVGSTGVVTIPKGPLVSVTSITTYDTSDSANVFDSSNYLLDTSSSPPRVFLKYGMIWPVDLRPINSVTIRFVAGFGATADLLPDDLTQACRIMLAHYHENREPIIEGRGLETPLSVRAILDPYRVLTI